MSTQSTVRPRSGLRILLIVTTVVGLALDQVSKALAVRDLSDGTVTPLLGDFLSLRLLRNSGAAFSVGSDFTWVFTLAAALIVVAILYFARQVGTTVWAISLGVLLAGALGNLVDRLFRAPGFPHGHVVDFIDYNGWFVGNVADIFIVLAGIVIAILFLRGSNPDGTTSTKSEPPSDPPTEGDAASSPTP